MNGLVKLPNCASVLLSAIDTVTSVSFAFFIRQQNKGSEEVNFYSLMDNDILKCHLFIMMYLEREKKLFTVADSS